MNGASDDLVRDLQLCQCGHMRADHGEAEPHPCKVCDDPEICDGFKARGVED